MHRLARAAAVRRPGPWGRRFASDSSAARIRNLGIIAHIDAGKTTTTERMLYYAGVTKRLGNVDSGDTVTDFLDAERQRGITIQSAAITFDWHAHQINLIDTPGHADFNFEVVRSLRVLDGAVTILDAVAGVEALTEKVWALAAQLGIPRIVYINKMDRPGAGFSRTVREVVSKLKTRVVLLNIPYFEGDRFAGIIDVLHSRRIAYKSDDGRDVDLQDCAATPQAEEARQARQALIEQLGELDEQVVEEFVETDAVGTETLMRALQRAVLANEIVPVLCGASFRNIGIQPLLDAAVQYLPSPLGGTNGAPAGLNKNGPSGATGAPPSSAPQAEPQAEPEAEREPLRAQPAARANDEVVRMLAFKVREDPQRGTLVYVRVYSGTLKRNTTILNTANQQTERATGLLRMQADEPVKIDSVAAGDIAVLSGTSHIRTGDTLVAHATKPNGVRQLRPADTQLALLPIPVPPPVFVTRIGPKGPGDARGMRAALDVLLREDPSLHLAYDDEAGQYLLSGMGELHLEIAVDRLTNDFKARVDVGDVMITYKETLRASDAPALQPASPALKEPVCVRDSDASGAETQVTITLQSAPSAVDATRVEHGAKPLSGNMRPLIDSNLLKVTFARHRSIQRRDVERAAEVGVLPALAQGGPLGRYALFGLQFSVNVVIGAETDSVELVAPLVRAAATQALGSLDAAEFQLLEPVMNVSISIPQSYLGTVMNDVSTLRRGTIVGVSDPSEAGGATDPSAAGAADAGARFGELAQQLWTPVDHTMYMSKHADDQGAPVRLNALVPLRKMVGYLSSLRSMTQGRGTFEMTFSEFAQVPPQDLEEILDQ